MSANRTDIIWDDPNEQTIDAAYDVFEAWCKGLESLDDEPLGLGDFIQATNIVLSSKKETGHIDKALSELRDCEPKNYHWALGVRVLIQSIEEFKTTLSTEERAVLGEIRDYTLENYESISHRYQYQTPFPFANYIVTHLRKIDGKDVQHPVYDGFEKTKEEWSKDGVNWDPVDGCSVAIPEGLEVKPF